MSTESTFGTRNSLLSQSRLLLAATLGLIFASLLPQGALALTTPLLNRQQVGSSDITAFTKWTSVLQRYEEQRIASEGTCVGQGCLNVKWEELLTSLEGKPVQEQITAVNRFFNNIHYIADSDNYGVSDYWQTPYEMFARGGDCEDYAIGKYISLKRLGVSESDMRIVVVRDQNLGGIIHALLEVSTGEDRQILDNQSKSVKSITAIYNYLPVFAINESKWWAYK